jgi:hypothetical protein
MKRILMSYESINVPCSCCGRMIPADPIKKLVAGKELQFCSESCYGVYLDYKLPLEASIRQRE